MGCSCFHHLLCLLLLVTVVAAASNSSVGVRNDVELQQALLDPKVGHVMLLQDIQLQAENWQRKAGSRSNITDRNITISSEPPYWTLDFAFVASNWLRLQAGASLNISNTILKQARYGAGMQLDFLAPAAGTALILWNSIVVRHLCIESLDEPAAIEHVPRLPGFPGEQLAHYNTSYCFMDRCFEKVLTYDSFTKVSTSMSDTAAGGYGLAMFNVTKVCLDYAPQCSDSLIAESCMQRALDALPLAAQTPGRIQAAAEAATAAAAAAHERRRQQATLAGAISAGVGAFVLLMLLFGLLIRHRRSLRGSGGKAVLPVFQPPGPLSQASLPGCESAGNKDPQLSAAGEGAGPGCHLVRDAEVVLLNQPGSGTTRSSHSSRPVSQPGGVEFVQEHLVGPPSLQDQWELVAWKTSSHSSKLRLSGQQLLQHGVSDLAASLDSGQLSSPISAGSHKELSSRDLILQGTGTSTTQAVANANKIHMGVCIGAGSFGKVYRAKWRGMDVAVKVVHHSQAAAVSVANEVDLTMSFQHPNVVAAYHFVTWRRRKDRAHNSEQLLSPVHQMTHSSGSLSLSCGNNLAAGSPHSGFHLEDDDMQTYIVQEFCDAGNLGDYCIIHGARQEGQLPTGHEMLRLLFRLREVASGMQFLHDVASVVHGDLKSSNILLCVAPTAPYGRTAKVADFGLARVYAAGETHKSTRTLGTVNHMSPEMLRYGKASASADVYSFGIMMWELLTGQVAFRGWQWGAILEHVALSDGRPPIPEGAPEDFVLLLESCWHKDPARRPAFTEVVKCLSIMINSRHQELSEQAAGVTLRTHTVTAAVSTTAASVDPGDSRLSNCSTGLSQVSTGLSGVQMSAATVTGSSCRRVGHRACRQHERACVWGKHIHQPQQPYCRGSKRGRAQQWFRAAAAPAERALAGRPAAGAVATAAAAAALADEVAATGGGSTAAAAAAAVIATAAGPAPPLQHCVQIASC